MTYRLFVFFGLFYWSLLASAETDTGSYSASYRLLFQGEPVGESYFRFGQGADQGYRFEAYTQPSGRDGDSEAHEILEASSGTLGEDGTPQPESYYFSVFNGNETSLLEFLFDWPSKRLQITSKEKRATLDLEPETQDRLSYLLVLGRWITSDREETRFPIAQPGVTATAEFVRIDTTTIEVEAGSFETVHLLRVDAGDQLRRELWLEVAPPHRLIAMERHEPNGVTRMELISSKTPSSAP